MRGGHVTQLPTVLLLLLTTAVHSTTANDGGGNGGDIGLDFSKVSGILIPGFASTQLRAWSILDCPYSPLDFNPLDLVWLDTTKLISAVNCWIKCMSLDPYNQTDHPECKSRPDGGLSAITEIDPGYITGSFCNTVSRMCVSMLFGSCLLVLTPCCIGHVLMYQLPNDIFRYNVSPIPHDTKYGHVLTKYFEQAFTGGISGYFSEGHDLLAKFWYTENAPQCYIGPLSSVWKDWVKWCIEFGIEANAIVAVPYDWRLAPSKLEERDLYFHKLKLTFETALKLRGGPSLVFAHSMGNNVFRYFLEWLKLEIAPKKYIQWLDDHIHAYFAVGAPLLGATDPVKGALSGVTFGLPLSEGTARLMFNTFGSSLWMFPFSEHCKTDDTYWKHFSGLNNKGEFAYNCEENEHTKYSGWPTNIINIEIPSMRGDDAYPSPLDMPNTNSSKMECGLPTQLSFSAREIGDGTFFKTIEDYDPDSKRLLQLLKKSYHGDPVLNPLTPWERPPLKNIFCIYGIDSKTEVGYYFAPSGKPYPDNWIITDIVYEFEGSLYSRSGNLVEGNPGPVSGDETVPYHSLSWCKTWLGEKVNITRAPQSEHEGSDVQVHLNVEHEHKKDIIPNMTRSSKVKYITYYEDAESLPGKRTAVWELDKANHRNIVRSPVLMRELWLEMWHDIHPDRKSKFVTKAKRGPLRAEDCYWDYGKARCAWPEHCEYRYAFGDVHLGQSCRLKNSSADNLLHYV